jgi:hypothetical protein
MRVLRWLLVLLVFIPISLMGQQTPSDPYSLVNVKAAMDRISAGVGFGGDAKLIPRLGDGCAIAILKVTEEDRLTDPETALVASKVIRLAFARPKDISNKEDRDPRVSLFLLDYLSLHVSDQKVLREIQDTIAFLRHFSQASA